ncbi:MAG: MurR/RpiR family transcriptional regulator [Selenomonadaceae bacterium]|nr:MurR/RpiR family transcriptional regulator [Selenomonadaceae bacterium]
MRLLKAMQEAERFSPTEQSVIDYMLKNPRDLATLSIREVAERTFTSPAAVFRLCQKLGLKGYNEFKIRFMSEMGRTEGGRIPPVMRRPITDKDAPPDIVRKMAALEIEAIEETKNELDTAQLQRIVERMEAARCIDIYAYDQNYAIAVAAVYNLLQVKQMAVAHSSLNSQISQALISDDSHFAFIISRSGENKRLMRTAKILKERRVPVALLTCAREAPLASMCDEFIYVANTIEYLDCGGMIFSVGVRYYFDVLFGMLLARHYHEIESFYDVFEQNIGRQAERDRLW